MRTPAALRTDATPFAVDLRRATPPEFLVPSDFVALFALLDEGAAVEAILRGDFGPYSRAGDVLVVRRASFVEHLRGREVHPARGPVEHRCLPRLVPGRSAS